MLCGQWRWQHAAHAPLAYILYAIGQLVAQLICIHCAHSIVLLALNVHVVVVVAV